MPVLLILDTNCYGELLDAAVHRRVIGSLRSVGRAIWPSELNVLEFLKYENTSVRDQLLGVVSQLKGDRPLLPWPHRLLVLIAESIVNGATRFKVLPGVFDQLVADPRLIAAGHVQEAKRIAAEMEARYQASLDRGRKEAAKIRKSAGRDRQLLDMGTFWEQWSAPGNLEIYIEPDRKELGLSAAKWTADVVLAQPHWHLHYDAFGVVACRQVILKEQAKWVERFDLLQLVYMGDADIIVSKDRDFVAAAGDVLHGRYPGKRAMLWTDFWAGCQ